jgi:outer membrane protein
VNIRTISLTAALLVAGTFIAAAQGQRIGYVNSAKIFQEFPAAKDAQKKIDAIRKPMQDSLEAMQRDLQSRYEEYQRKEALYNDATKKAEQQKLIDQERVVNEYRQNKFGQDGDFATETEKILNPVREKIKSAISVVAKEERYNFVFDKTDQIQILLYGDPKDDITYKVIDKLNRGK